MKQVEEVVSQLRSDINEAKDFAIRAEFSNVFRLIETLRHLDSKDSSAISCGYAIRDTISEIIEKFGVIDGYIDELLGYLE